MLITHLAKFDQDFSHPGLLLVYTNHLVPSNFGKTLQNVEVLLIFRIKTYISCKEDDLQACFFFINLSINLTDFSCQFKSHLLCALSGSNDITH